ncbi:MAG: TolA-binding protein [Bacteroidia bacterium]
MTVFAPKKLLSLSLLILIQFSAFGQQKESWVKKNWHNMNARFNGLYIAKVQLSETKETLKGQNADDYNQILRVFPYGSAEQRVAQKPNLEEVYKKCSQVIKKHPKSKWVDDAWYLIGQSYLLQNDLFTAIETYQYVANQFPDGERRYDARLGILMSYIAQEKFYDAEAIMSVIKKEGEFPERLQKDFAAISAEIYIQQEKYLQGIDALQTALNLTKDRDERSRYNFILAQLYLKNKEIEKSKGHFIKTIKLNPPYELAFQSNLGLIKTIGLSDEKSLKTPRKYLKKMLADDKNIDYYDQIYYELANLEIQAENEAEAIRYYKLSASTSVKNQDQKANSYLALATIYFDRKNYESSQKYFDSTSMFMSNKRADYEYIKAKQIVLTDLIENLVMVYTQDSLLKLAGLPKAELDKRITAQQAYDLRQKQIEQDQADQNKPLIDDFDPFKKPNKVNTTSVVGGSWYFYNKAAVARGSNDFKRQWGNRPKSDLWRYVSMQAGLSNPDNQDSDSTDADAVDSYDPDQDSDAQDAVKNVAEDKKKYYRNIPFSKEAKAAALAKIEEALFNTGKIYYEDLKEFTKSRSYLTNLLSRFPDGRNEPETYFILNKIETELENTDEADRYSKLLDKKYPKNPFNLVLNNRELAEQMGGNNEVSKLYKAAYNAYKNEDYEKALAFKNEANEKYAGNSLGAKFDYLQALIVGRTKGKEAYIIELQRIVELYPGTRISNQASYTLQYLREIGSEDENETESKKYVFDPGEKHYFVVIYDGGSKNDILAGFSDYNTKNHNSDQISVKNYLVGEKDAIAAQTFSDKDKAEAYYVEFIKNDKFFKDLGIRAYDLYIISQSNFRTLLMDGNADAYTLFFVRNYIQ